MSAWVGNLVTQTVAELDAFEPARRRALRAMKHPVEVQEGPLGREQAHDVEVFVDVNLLYYANTHSPDPCHARARDLVESLWTDPGRAAISARAPLLWSEDLVDGQRSDDVRIVNPLRTQ